MARIRMDHNVTLAHTCLLRLVTKSKNDAWRSLVRQYPILKWLDCGSLWGRGREVCGVCLFFIVCKVWGWVWSYEISCQCRSKTFVGRWKWFYMFFHQFIVHTNEKWRTIVENGTDACNVNSVQVDSSPITEVASIHRNVGLLSCKLRQCSQSNSVCNSNAHP